MPAEIFIPCPSGEEGAIRGDLEYDVEEFFGTVARFNGGGGVPGVNLDLELVAGEDVETWVVHLQDFLKQVNARPNTLFEIFPLGGRVGPCVWCTPGRHIWPRCASRLTGAC
jgi:hypothetical protein